MKFDFDALGGCRRGPATTLAAAWMMLALGCGSRSGLAGDDSRAAASGGSGEGGNGVAGGAGASAAGGAGGAGASGGTGGVGGQGGAPAACNGLVQVGEAVPLPSLPGGTQGAPQIHALPDGRAAVVHARVSPANGATGMVNTVVSWLDLWPPAFEPPVELDPARGWSFAVDRGSSPSFAVLAGTSAAPPGISYAFVDAIGGSFFPSLETSSSASRALSVRGGQYRQLVGMEEPGPFLGGASYHLLAGWVHQPPNGIQYEGPYVLGCSDRPGKIDGLETAEGRLVVQPVPPGACLDDVGPSPPTALTVTRLANDGMWYFGLSVAVGSPITDLFVAPRPSGGWIAYGLEQSAAEPPRLEAVRMDDLGLLSYGPISITPPGSAPFAFDADAFGDGGLVAAFVDDPANNPPDLRVVVVGEDGALSTAHIEDAGFLEKPRVLGNAQEGSILVAFGRPTPGGGSAVHLARFDCQP